MNQCLHTAAPTASSKAAAHETELLRFSEQLQPLLRAHRDTTEAERRIAAPIVDRLLDSGVCRMALTADAGGLETDPVVACHVYENLARGEGAAAWVVWNNSLPCFVSRALDRASRQALFNEPRRMLICATRMSGTARVVEGGFLVSGRWSLVSGCELAEWIAVMATVVDGDRPRMAAPNVPDARFFFVHRSDLAIHDTWHASGLRGTGSHDVTVDDVLVPADRMCSWFETSRVDSAFGRLPFFSILTAGCASICLGLAGAALDGLREVIATKVQTNPLPELRLRPEVLALVARAEHFLATSHREVHDALGEIRDACEGAQATPQQRARLWRSSIVTAERCRTLVGEIVDAAGTPALYQRSPMERAHRDLQAALQHVVFDCSSLADAGRVSLGLEVDNPMF